MGRRSTIAIIGSLCERLRSAESSPSREEAMAGEAIVGIARAALMTPDVHLAVTPAMVPLVAATGLDLSSPVGSRGAEPHLPFSIVIIQPERQPEGMEEALTPFLKVINANAATQRIDIAGAAKADLIFLLGDLPEGWLLHHGRRGPLVYFRSLLTSLDSQSSLARLWPNVIAGEDLLRPAASWDGPADRGEHPRERAADEFSEPYVPFGLVAEAAIERLQSGRSAE